MTNIRLIIRKFNSAKFVQGLDNTIFQCFIRGRRLAYAAEMYRLLDFYFMECFVFPRSLLFLHWLLRNILQADGNNKTKDNKLRWSYFSMNESQKMDSKVLMTNMFNYDQ